MSALDINNQNRKKTKINIMSCNKCFFFCESTHNITYSYTQYNLAIEKEKRNNNKYANPLTRILISDRILHKNQR